MKTKLFLLGLMAALALPMTAQTATKAQMMARNDRSQLQEIIPFKVVDQTPNLRADNGLTLWDFETDESFAGWLIYDADGDGYNWEVDNYYSYNGGTTSLTSRSYYGSALEPDNWLISPEVALDGTLTIHAMNYSGSWPDVFAVYVYVGGQPETEDDFADFVQISEDITAPAEWTEYTFDMSEYEGRTGCFAIRHYNSYDLFRVLIDYISIGTEVPVPATPTELSVEPATTSAGVMWTDEENAAWNLRYRLYTEQPEPTGYFEDFESYSGTGAFPVGGWTQIDADGDGNGWYLWDPIYNGYDDAGDGVQLNGTKCITSASYLSAPLNPDNWLVSPEVTLTGELSFYAGGQDPSWASEVFAVYVSVGDGEWVKISEDITATSPIQKYTFDLSEFEGMTGQVAIRHYNVSDMFRLNIDDVLIGELPEPVEEAEWIYVYDLNDNFYTINGLDPETTYEVQVQATNGEMTSDWTESCIFTTKGIGSGVEELNYVEKVDGAYYNLMGQKMNPNNLPAGIYIHNGKKFIVK